MVLLVVGNGGTIYHILFDTHFSHLVIEALLVR